MKTYTKLNEMHDALLELQICTFEEIQLVTKIKGYNEQALNDIVYARTGYPSLDQYQLKD